MKDTTAAPASPQATPGVITLETPIVRGEQRIESITLRKPAAGELRGIKLADLLNADVGSILTLLPRITSPTLTAHEAAELDTVDLAAVTGEVIGFFMSRAQRTALSQ